MRLSILIAIIVSVFSTGAAASDWELTRQEDGIKVYRRSMENSKLLSFKGVGVIDAPIEKVLSVILDTDRVKEWSTNLTECKVLEGGDFPREFTQYDQMDMPWPLDDRIFISRIRISMDPETLETRVKYSHSDHPMDADDAVRAEAAGSYYILRPVEDGKKTLAIGVAVADPKGRVPKWLVNFYQRKWPMELIQALRVQVAKPDVETLPSVEQLYKQTQ